MNPAPRRGVGMKEKCQKNQRILVIDDSESIHEDFQS